MCTVFRFSKFTATNNLISHLEIVHKISVDKPNLEKTQQKITELFQVNTVKASSISSNIKSNASSSNKKSTFMLTLYTIQLAIVCALDFKTFCHNRTKRFQKKL